jgi:uncharacterized membrane protein YkoI
MKTKSVLALGLTALLSGQLLANEMKDEKLLVPESKLIKTSKKKKHFQTTAGSVVKLEFEKSGELEEASGKAALTGDVFVPSPDLKSLKTVTDAVTKAGKTLTGKWSFEHKFIKGWVYEFEGKEKDVKMEYLVDAKEGVIIKEEKDDDD